LRFQTTLPLLVFRFPAVQRRKVLAAFDGGRLTSDGGVMLLAAAARHLGIADKLARCSPTCATPPWSPIDALRGLWMDAGLEAVEVREIPAQRSFPDFHDFWTATTGSTLKATLAGWSGWCRPYQTVMGVRRITRCMGVAIHPSPITR
jgi:hypothetical protein